MDVNEVDPGRTSFDSGASREVAVAPRSGLLASSWRGAKTGFRRTSYIIGPLASVLLIAGLVPTALGPGAGRGFAVPSIVPAAIALYAMFAFLGTVAGGLIGLVVPVRPGTRRANWWAAAHRPIRLFRRRPVADAPADGAPRTPRRRLWPWLVGIPALVVLAIAFCAGIYAQRTVSRRLEEAIAAADRDDPNWRIDDLMAHREPVPDAENSALVLAEALALLPESWPHAPAPGHPNPQPTEASHAYDRMQATADNVRLDDGTADSLTGALQEYGEAVQIARTVADYPRGRHELELGPTLIDTPLPDAQAARAAARILAADAAMRAQSGDIDGAVDSCRALLNTGRSMGDEPFIISQLVRIAIGSVAMKSMRRVLGQGEPSEPSLARLQALVADERGHPVLLYGMRGERATLIEVIRRVGAGEVPISALSDAQPPFDPGKFRAAIAPWGKLWFDNQQAVGLEWMNQAVAIARRPAVEQPALWKAWDDQVAGVKKSRFGIYTSTLPLLLMPAVSSAGSAFGRYQAELGATAIMLAAERHRRKTGAWPESIAAIDRAILPGTPLDPFSGEVYRMEHRDGRLFIYSIGPNHKDEHGAFEPKKWTTGGPDDIGAIGWDVDRRRRPAAREQP